MAKTRSNNAIYFVIGFIAIGSIIAIFLSAKKKDSASSGKDQLSSDQTKGKIKISDVQQKYNEHNLEKLQQIQKAWDDKHLSNII